MYFSKASSAALNLQAAHSELRTTVPGLDKHVVAGLFDEGVADGYSEFFAHMNIGTALLSRDFVGAGWSILRQTKVSPVINLAVSGLVTSSWYSLKYPLVGGFLQWAAGAGTIGGVIGSWFGPPALLVNAATFGATLAVLYPLNEGVKGIKRRRSRSKEIEFTKVAIPAVVATAQADGEISAEEIRVLRDLLQMIPRDESFDARATVDELIDINAAQKALDNAESISLSKKRRKRVLRFATLTALADNHFDGREKKFLKNLAKTLKLSDSFEELSQEVEEELQTELHLAEAGLRLVHALAHVDGRPQQDAAELIDMIMISTIGPETDRRRLVSLLKDKPVGSVFSSRRLLHPFPETKKGFIAALNPMKKCERTRAVNYVVNQGISFVHTLETIREQELPSHRDKLVELAERYAVSKEEISKRREEYVKELKAAEKRRNKLDKNTGNSRCPGCEAVGTFQLSKKRHLTRNEYECTKCKQRTLLCRAPDCTGMTSAGDFWNDELCEEHSIF